MPSAKILDSKQTQVVSLVERIKASTAGVLVDYKGITVSEDNELRNQLRDAGIEYTVIKNSLVRFAANEVGYVEFDPLLHGATSLATTQGDPIIPYKILNDYAKKLGNRFEIKGGYLEGAVAPIDDIRQIAELPSKDGLLSQVLGTFLAPISSLAVVLDQIAKQKEAAGEA